MVTGYQLFLFYIIGWWLAILGMLVTRDEGYFLVIVINFNYILDTRKITSPFTTPTTDDDDYIIRYD